MKGKTTMAKQKVVMTAHAKALASIKIDADHPALAWFNKYLPNFDRWGVDKLGSVPTPAMIAVATVTCKKAAGVECVNVAMAVRPEGVQVSQYLNASGAEGAAHNHLGTLVKGGIFAAIDRGAKVKCAQLTEYGAAEINKLLIARGLKAAPKVSKPKAVKVTRPRNKKAAPTEALVADQPVSEPVSEAPVSETALADLAAHFNS